MSPSSTSSSEAARPIVDGQGVVIVPEDLGLSRARRALAQGVIALFLAVIVATPVIDGLWPVAPKVPTGDEKIKADLARAEARVLDGTRAKLLERDLEARSRVRHSFAPPYAFALYVGLGQVHPQVLVGREHWVFLRGRADPPTMPDELLAARAGTMLAALQRRLADVGTRLVTVIVPRKEVACAQMLPPGFDARPSLDAAILRDLARRGVDQVDLLQLFAEQPDSLYYPFGTHWNERAQRLAAQAIARHLQLLKPRRKRLGRLTQRTSFVNDFDLLVGPVGLSFERALEFCKEHSPQEDDLLSARKGERNPRELAKEVERVAVAGTSFSAGGKFCHLLQHFTAEPIFDASEGGRDPSWSLRQAILRERRPEIVVLEIPVSLLYAWGFPLPSLGEVFARLPPAGVTTVKEDAEVRAAGVAREITFDGEDRTVVALPAGTLAHDGAASLRLRGSFELEQVRVIVWNAGESSTFVWPRGVDPIVLPLYAPVATQGALYVELRAPSGTVRLDEIALVVPGEAERAQELGISAPSRDAAGAWQQELQPPSDEVVAPRSLFVARLASKTALAQPVELEATSQDGRHQVWSFGELAPGAFVVLDLVPWAGERIASVRLRAAAGPPDAGLDFARILPPFPARTE